MGCRGLGFDYHNGTANSLCQPCHLAELLIILEDGEELVSWELVIDHVHLINTFRLVHV